MLSGCGSLAKARAIIPSYSEKPRAVSGLHGEGVQDEREVQEAGGSGSQTSRRVWFDCFRPCAL